MGVRVHLVLALLGKEGARQIKVFKTMQPSQFQLPWEAQAIHQPYQQTGQQSTQQAAQAAQQAAQAAQQAAHSAQQAARQPAQASHQQPLWSVYQPSRQQPAQQVPAQQSAAGQRSFQTAQPSPNQQQVQSPGQPMALSTQPGPGAQAPRPQQPEPVSTPFVDVYDASDRLIVFADIPGVESENIRLEGNDRTLRIICDRPPAEEEQEFEAVQQERLRRAERTIQLPTNVEVEDAEATCENGVCKVILPKEEQHTIGVQ